MWVFMDSNGKKKNPVTESPHACRRNRSESSRGQRGVYFTHEKYLLKTHS